MKFFILLIVFLVNSLISISAAFPANLRDGFLIQDIGSGDIRITQMDIVTGDIVKTDVLSVGGTGNNAYGYNPIDNYIYGIQIKEKNGNDDYNLVRIESSGGGFSATVKPIIGLDHNIFNGMFIGDFDKEGNMYVGGDNENSTSGPIFKITINSNGSVAAEKLSAERGSPRFADWGYTDRIGGEERFYFVSDNGGLYYFKKSGNTLQKVGPISSNLTTGGTVIGTFIAGTDLFYYPSESRTLYKVDLLNPSQGSQKFSTVANPSSSGDAARNYKIIIPDLAIAKGVTNGTVFNQGEDIKYKITVKNTGDYPLGDQSFNSQYIVTDKIDPQKVNSQATLVTAILYPTLTGNVGTPVAGFPTTIDYTVSSPNIGLFKLTSDSGVLPLIPKGARLEIEYTLKSKIYFMTKDEDTIINVVTGEVPNKEVKSDAQVEVKTLPPELKIEKDVEPKKPLQKGESLQYTLKIKNTSTTKSSTSNVVKDILKADVNEAFETFSVYQSDGTTLVGEVIDTDGNSSNDLISSFSNGETTITIETIPTLGSGEEKIYIIKGLTKASFNGNVLVNYGTVDSKELDLVTSNEVESTFKGEKVYDYGDAPDRYKTITSNPPRHKQVENTPYFGAGVDYETVWTQPLGADADLDDRSQRDDEDGIVAVNGILSNSNLPITLIEGIENTITINVGKVTQGGAKVKIWLDGLNGNINETFDNNTNQVIYNGSVNSSGNIDVKFNLDVLGNRAETQGRTYLRMRITSSKNDNQINSAGGVADDGEVEDHLVFISQRKTDYGDLPDTYKTRLSSDGPRHLDIYLFGQTSFTNQNMYLGENKNYENDAPSSLTGVEDAFDDGVKNLAGNVLSTLYVNEDNILTIKASHVGYVGMWVDFNGDGTFDMSESIIQQVVAGDNQLTIPASRFSNYPDTSLGNLKGVRIRYSKEIDGVNKPNGLALTGEVEDYYIPFIKKVIGVEILKTPVTEKIDPNGIAKYSLVITNTGNQPLSNYILEDKPDLLKVDIGSLNVTSITVNGAPATGATFEANASGVIKLIGAPTIEVGNKLEILYELTARDFDISQGNVITNIASLVAKPGDPEQKSQADVLVVAATVTKTSPQAGKIVQPGDKVEYVITLTNSTTEKLEEFILYDGLLADNSFLTLNDITKVPTIVGNSLFASGGVKVDVQANSKMEIKYELTVPSIPANIALPVEITNAVLDQKVVVTVDKPKLTLRHDVFKYDSKYEDVNELIAIEKPIVDNFESIEGKNAAPPIVYPGEDVLYYISLINTGKVEAKGRTDIGHEVNSIPKDDDGKQALIKNEFKGVVFTNLDDGSKKYITQDQLSNELGLTIEETLFYFSEKIAPRSAVSFVTKSKINPEGRFSKKPELELYAYLTNDISQNDKKGELRRTVIQIGRRSTDLILNKKVEIEEASIGKFVPYTLQIKNVGLDDAVDVFILDKIPPGFIYVDGSAVLVLDDGIQQTKIPTTGVKEITFGPIPLIESGDTIEIKYLLKVGVGVKPGTYKNTAVTQDNRSNPTSNYDSVDIEIVSDPIFEHTTIIGKVFHDRDGDGIQDYADAKNLIVEVKMPKGVYIPNTTMIYKNGGKYFFSDSYKTITLRELKGRKSNLESPTNNMVVIRKQINTASMATVRVQSNQGTDIIQQNDGKVITRYTGDKAKGLTSQDIVITQRVIKDSSDKMFLEIFILNNGIQEEGLPGVRLATPEGIVVETDRYGRYHVPPVAETIGRNYIIKVDPATLPKGSEFTTENPKVRQVGKVMMKFNFGVKLPEFKK